MPNTEVVFYAHHNKELMVGAESIRPEKRNQATGAQIRPSGVIQFRHGLYRTSDPKEIKLLREGGSFKIGRIREITEEEAAAVSGIPSTVSVSGQAVSGVGVEQ